jgi:serine/threonine protein kinase/formylglycine-generating enzyme required for sulfatase activity
MSNSNSAPDSSPPPQPSPLPVAEREVQFDQRSAPPPSAQEELTVDQARGAFEPTIDRARQIARERPDTAIEKTPTAIPAHDLPAARVESRYRKLQKLGEGAFGIVWLAEDLDLHRQVALKEPRLSRHRRPQAVETYLREARVLASLDHPHIVPIYDVARTQSGSCFLVSKLIDGQDLLSYVQQQQISYQELTRIFAQVADGLQHTHNCGLIHRDIKPANILIDGRGHPYVTDFGLALRDEELSQQQGVAGTPSYMSPEQARDEGHLIDARSDIFSLGVVMYELLTGAKPFRGLSWEEILEQIRNVEAKPPRQRNPQIPKELERICLKALAKRAADRYRCAADLAADLRNWAVPAKTDVPSLSSTIVPKGLRSFEANDSCFFLALLPGPRDRDGLPESLRFWKTRIEADDPEQTFRVAVVYGPSGCGKSSLIKAGLLPRLSDRVIPVFLDATSDQTDEQLLRSLRRASIDLPPDVNMLAALTAIRRGRGIPAGRKLLIVIDQFEQWLHTQRLQPSSKLADALRQCDGERIQAMLLVRDDFYSSVNRLMQQIEVPLQEGRNLALVDLFDRSHARQTLAEFGRAYGRLPDDLSAINTSQQAFLDAAVAGLAQDDKIVCVHLSLFADMMKSREWTPETWQQVGGTQGLGATFLDETFSNRSAPASHRKHQQAARLILQALLPDVGADIKGQRRTAAELQSLCGYESQPIEFRELLQILDQDVRLITPLSLDGEEPTFQLTHDYLIPALREWLTRKQRETRAGRAELKLQERSASWKLQPENRYLPSLGEYLRICSFTNRKRWTETQRRMMSKATRLYSGGIALALLLICLTVSGSVFLRSQMRREQEVVRVRGLAESLVTAEPGQLTPIITDLHANSKLATEHLSEFLDRDPETAAERRAQLHARIATVAQDATQVEPLLDELLNGNLAYFGPIRQQLRMSPEYSRERWEKLLRDDTAAEQHRLRAAMMLAVDVSPEEADFWTESDLQFVARKLSQENVVLQPQVREALRPIRHLLLPELQRIFSAKAASQAERMGAALAIADYAQQDLPLLSRLIIDASPEQFQLLYPLLASGDRASVVTDLAEMVAKSATAESKPRERVVLGQQRANAAITLLRLGNIDHVLPVFQGTDDVEALTQFIFRFRPRGVGIEALLQCFDRVCSADHDRYPLHSRYALLMALGEFKLTEIPSGRREELLTLLADWYAHDPSSGIHGASGWLLRQWGQNEIVTRVDHTEVPYSPDREWFTLKMDVQANQETATNSVEAADATAPVKKQTFYGTFIVFAAGDYEIGSVVDEPERHDSEFRHTTHIDRPFAILDREVTMAEMIAFVPAIASAVQQYKAEPSDAVFTVNWYDSLNYCRWLNKQLGIAEAEQPYPNPDSLDARQYPRETNHRAQGAPRNWPVFLNRRGLRLPMETEWEVAGRAGTKTSYSFGGDVELLQNFGWFVQNGGKRVHPPRSLRPNPRGLFDMHGNVFEWTNNWFDDYAAAMPEQTVAPVKMTHRVVRGGSWAHLPEGSRSALRDREDPVSRRTFVGFRLALSL